jgi:hypothetical protein
MTKHQLNEFSAYYLFCRPKTHGTPKIADVRDVEMSLKNQSIYKIPPVMNFETEIMQSAIDFGTKMTQLSNIQVADTKKIPHPLSLLPDSHHTHIQLNNYIASMRI